MFPIFLLFTHDVLLHFVKRESTVCCVSTDQRCSNSAQCSDDNCEFIELCSHKVTNFLHIINQKITDRRFACTTRAMQQSNQIAIIS